MERNRNTDRDRNGEYSETEEGVFVESLYCQLSYANALRDFSYLDEAKSIYIRNDISLLLF